MRIQKATGSGWYLMEDGSKQQIRKTDLENYQWVDGNPTKTEDQSTDVDRKLAPVRESGTVFVPEQSNFHHYGEPAPVRPPLGEDTE